MEYLKQSLLRDRNISHFTVIMISKRIRAIEVTIKVHLFNNGNTCD